MRLEQCPLPGGGSADRLSAGRSPEAMPNALQPPGGGRGARRGL